jgi:hypothetical protein
LIKGGNLYDENLMKKEKERIEFALTFKRYKFHKIDIDQFAHFGVMKFLLNTIKKNSLKIQLTVLWDVDDAKKLTKTLDKVSNYTDNIHKLQIRLQGERNDRLSLENESEMK